MRDSQLRASIEAMQGGDADAERAKLAKTSVEGIDVPFRIRENSVVGQPKGCPWSRFVRLSKMFYGVTVGVRSRLCRHGISIPMSPDASTSAPGRRSWSSLAADYSRRP